MGIGDIRLKPKLLLCFGVIIVAAVVFAVLAVAALRITADSYQNKLDYSQQRVHTVQSIRYSVMDLRRITTAIRADSGNMSRMEQHSADSSAMVALVNNLLDTYEELTHNDNSITSDDVSSILSKVGKFRPVLLQYKSDLIDVNIEHGKVGDLESLSANTAAQSALIASLQSTIDEMMEYERALAQVLIDATEAQSDMYRGIFIVAGIVIALVAIVIALIVANHVSKPLVALSKFLHKAGTTGDVSVEPDEEALLESFMRRKDEIGQMMTDCGAFIDHVCRKADEMDLIANGDLTVDITLLSNCDTMGKSMQMMIENFNDMFRELNSASSQVSVGSKQTSEGAQSLAQGSTDQAASVEELSSSITEIAQTAKSSTELANKTAELSAAIMGSAERGSQQMGEMIDAVSDIKGASQSISKIIKTIDDIAFQTNILALNAAVEAARAGQHGKGFAVVAEEVRNLASKSAEAARDTGSLIADSVEKSELGFRIANETAESFKEIVQGLSESTQKVSDISRTSEEQLESISQINVGIDMVARIIQQNAATAEQSAAASHEMSSQSDRLQGMVSRFKLL